MCTLLEECTCLEIRQLSASTGVLDRPAKYDVAMCPLPGVIRKVLLHCVIQQLLLAVEQDDSEAAKGVSFSQVSDEAETIPKLSNELSISGATSTHSSYQRARTPVVVSPQDMV